MFRFSSLLPILEVSKDEVCYETGLFRKRDNFLFFLGIAMGSSNFFIPLCMKVYL